MTKIYAYEAFYYNECEEKDATSRGFVIGESFENATEKISRYYGEDNLYSCKITSINDYGIIETPELFPEISFNSLVEENSF